MRNLLKLLFQRVGIVSLSLLLQIGVMMLLASDFQSISPGTIYGRHHCSAADAGHRFQARRPGL